MDTSNGTRERKLPGAEFPIQFDVTNPDETVELRDGKTGLAWNIRCRVPFKMGVIGSYERATIEAPVATEDPNDRLAPSQRAALDPDGVRSFDEDDEFGNAAHHVIIQGVSSSTSTDWYETEMSAMCLQDMAVQMRDGVPYVPTHSDSEWMHVFGRTFEAGMIPEEVAKPADKSEQGFILKTRSRLDLRRRFAKELLERIDDNEQVGQSIGGWFTEIRVISSDDGELERVIVEKVELDHLAVTRQPANPDSWIEGIRSAVASAGGGSVNDNKITLNVRSKAPEVADEPTEEPTETTEEPAEESIDEVRAASDAPAYRPADNLSARSCETCLNFAVDDGETGRCSLFDFRDRARIDYVCDEWSPKNDEVAETDELLNDEPEAPDVRTVTEFLDLPLEVDGEWSFTTEDADGVLGVNGDNWERFRHAHAWMDSEADPESRDSYKLPIAKVTGTSLTVYLNGVAAAMGSLDQVPEDDRTTVRDHLIKYYEKAGQEPPELKSTPVSPDNLDEGEAAVHESDMPTTREEDMTEEFAQKLLSAVNDLSSEVGALRAQRESEAQAAPAEEEEIEVRSPEPAPEPVEDPRIAEMEERLERQERTIHRLAHAPVRRASHIAGMPDSRDMVANQAAGWMAEGANRAKVEGCVALAAVMNTRTIEQATAGEYGYQNPDGTQMPLGRSRKLIKQNLSAVINASVADGIITLPGDKAVWS